MSAQRPLSPIGHTWCLVWLSLPGLLFPHAVANAATSASPIAMRAPNATATVASAAASATDAAAARVAATNAAAVNDAAAVKKSRAPLEALSSPDTGRIRTRLPACLEVLAGWPVSCYMVLSSTRGGVRVLARSFFKGHPPSLHYHGPGAHMEQRCFESTTTGFI